MNHLLTILEQTDIRFPGLKIVLRSIGDGFHVFGFRIAYYGVCIGLAMVLGYLLADQVAKRTGQNRDLYLDFTIIAVILSVAGARLYYVIFNWKQFADNPLSVFNLRTGGLAIYGGVIVGVLTAIIFAKVKKLNIGQFLDTAVLGLLTGQIIGRWGNFFNRECFGTYTKSLFAMQVDVRDVSGWFNPNTPVAAVYNEFGNRTTALERVLKIRENAETIEGATYISVHPTFLYESVWNLLLLIILLILTKRKRFDGEILLLYLFGYGLGRLWIEGLRTDQLFLFGTSIAVSQLFSGLLVIGSAAIFVRFWRKNHKKKATA
ncbi:MAG: prolipoprotein diacylglyceryl transferase [Lachnospiraceae bacterium]|nr:prolipoprotein diacylglyceryl transferase [Lachnospiraceae bacterium]